MGMAASQARLLSLTSRQNDIRQNLMSLSMSKMDLARDVQKVTKEYQNALSAKTLKWSNNNGVTKVDMTYATLMRPGELNGNKPYMITDNKGKIVIDEKYLEYAKMISENGGTGNWEEVRYDVLSAATGIDADTIKNSEGYKAAMVDNNYALMELKAQEPKKTKLANTSTSDLLGKLSSSDLKTKYDSGEGIDAALVIPQMTALKSLSKYFGEDSKKFTEACDAAIAGFTIDTENPKKYTIQEIMDTIVAAYSVKGGEVSETKDPAVKTVYLPVWYEVDSAEYQKWQSDHAVWQQKMNEAQANYDKSLDAGNLALTAEQESKIKFYDALFSTIADKGWTCNSKVGDSDYLAQMMLNGMYTLTTVDRTQEEDDEGEYKYQNKYDSDIATNCTKIIQVSDTDAKDLALIKYENEKAIIDAKEIRVDARMKNLETEQNAIQQMMQGIQKIISDNMESTLNIFS